MKRSSKRIGILLAAAVLLTLAALTPQVRAAGPVVVTVGSVASAAPGATVTVPVWITNNPGYGTYTGTLTFDSQALTLISVSKGMCNPETKIIAYACADNTAGGGVLAELTFAVSPEAAAGEYPVGLTDFTLYDAVDDALPMETAVTGGTVTVTASPAPAPGYDIGPLTVLNGSGEALEAIPDGSFQVSVPVRKLEAGEDCLVFLAKYTAAGQYRGLMYVRLRDAQPGSTVELILPVENPGGDVAVLKAFVVDSFGSLTPLGAASTFG